MRRLLLLHAFVLLLASTDFTLVTSLFGGDSLRWCYYRYVSQSGWGYEYVSDDSLPVVATYITAFVLGIFGFCLAWSRGLRVVGVIGVVLSCIGIISFAIEGSHWLVAHNWSWLLFSPVAMFLLVGLACLCGLFSSPDYSKVERNSFRLCPELQ